MKREFVKPEESFLLRLIASKIPIAVDVSIAPPSRSGSFSSRRKFLSISSVS